MLTTLDRFKKHLGVEDDSQDDMYTMYILAASQAIENYCRRSFKRQVYSEVVEGSGSPFLILRNFPVYSGTAFLPDNRVVELKPSEDGMMFSVDRWPVEIRSVNVTYEAGYVLPIDATDELPRTLPEAVEVACLFLSQNMMESSADVKSERVGNISVTYGDNGMFSMTVQSLLSPYVGRWV